ncbi:thioredoxin-dependent thiol peroxidase [Bartonella sp. HY761]|uniref:thioredoxin-dependent thiol peroxidase n=1 Tax=Bartonella sp. HY761 TaxID=2979330 RepID=UPI00220ADB4A|nr:thioredoxin-dependent thiol peroxidase [Bartonella sp. HY761]UXN07591.1 thioredoxin-dependent thiol peroxidase [Bartonella sp. HY761]
MSDLNIGDKAPEFTLPDDNGDMVSLKELQGKPVVLYFYPKDDTSGCTTEALDFTALINQFRDIGVRVLGISPDSVKKHDKFKEKHQLAVELLADEEKTVLTAYGVWVEKSMYGRKYMGVERTTLLLDANGTIAEIWRKVKVTGHAEAVLKAAQALVA